MFKNLSCHNVAVLAILPLILTVCMPAFAGNKGNGRNLNELRQGLLGSPASLSLDKNIRLNSYGLVKTPDRQVVAVAANDESFQDQKPGEEQWKAKLLEAQQRRSSGITWFAVGLGGGTLLTIVGISTLSVPLYLVGGLGGSVATVYGIVVWVSANDDIDNLKTEGQMKGYMSSISHQSGPRLSVAIPF